MCNSVTWQRTVKSSALMELTVRGWRGMTVEAKKYQEVRTPLMKIEQGDVIVCMGNYFKVGS